MASNRKNKKYNKYKLANNKQTEEQNNSQSEKNQKKSKGNRGFFETIKKSFNRIVALPSIIQALLTLFGFVSVVFIWIIAHLFKKYTILEFAQSLYTWIYRLGLLLSGLLIIIILYKALCKVIPIKKIVYDKINKIVERIKNKYIKLLIATILLFLVMYPFSVGYFFIYEKIYRAFFNYSFQEPLSRFLLDYAVPNLYELANKKDGDVLENDYYYITLNSADNKNIKLSDCSMIGEYPVEKYVEEDGTTNFRIAVPNNQKLANVLSSCEASFSISEDYSNNYNDWHVSHIQCNDNLVFNSIDELKNHPFTSDNTCSFIYVPDAYGQGETIEEIMKPDGQDDRNFPIVAFYDYDGTLLKVTTTEYGESVEPPVLPEHEGMFFSNWSGDIDNVYYSKSVMAKYKHGEETYTIIYVLDDPNSATLSSYYFDVEYGKTIEENGALPEINVKNPEKYERLVVTNPNADDTEKPINNFKDVVVKGNYTFVIKLIEKEGE